MRVTLALCFRGYGRPRMWNSVIRKRWTKLGESRMRWRGLPSAQTAPELAPRLEQAEDMFHSDRYGLDVLRTTEWMREAWQPPVDLAAKLLEVEGPVQPPVQPQARLAYGWPRRLEAGLDQAALLTNCATRQGLSPAHSALLDQSADEMDTQELRLLQEAVLHAHLWQTDEEHLPRRVHREKLQIVPRAEYGIHPVRVVRYLLENLVRLAATSGMAPVGGRRLELQQHRLLERLPLWHNTQVFFDETHDVALFGGAPLQPLQLGGATRGAPLRCMAPVSPLVDMHLVERYFAEADVVSDGLASRTADPLHRHPHLVTLNLALPNTWSDFNEPEARPVTPSQRAGALLLSAYAQAASSARERFGAKAVDEPDERLPEPIVIQAIACDGVNFDFCALQVNTLRPCQRDSDLDHADDSIAHNDAWLDVDNQLVEKVLPLDRPLPEALYRNLEPLVYRKLLSFYRYGML